MKKDPNIQKIILGTREVYFCKGSNMLPYIPDEILPQIHIALADQNLKWNNDIILRCTLVFDPVGTYTVMLDHNPQQFNGTMLFSFRPEPKNGHTFDFPLKGKHLDIYANGKFNI